MEVPGFLRSGPAGDVALTMLGPSIGLLTHKAGSMAMLLLFTRGLKGEGTGHSHAYREGCTLTRGNSSHRASLASSSESSGRPGRDSALLLGPLPVAQSCFLQQTSLRASPDTQFWHGL